MVKIITKGLKGPIRKYSSRVEQKTGRSALTKLRTEGKEGQIDPIVMHVMSGEERRERRALASACITAAPSGLFYGRCWQFSSLR